MIYALDGNVGHIKEQKFEWNITSATYYRQIENQKDL